MILFSISMLILLAIGFIGKSFIGCKKGETAVIRITATATIIKTDFYVSFYKFKCSI